MASEEYNKFVEIYEASRDTKNGYVSMSWDASNYLKDPARSTEFLEKVLLLDLGGYQYAYYTAIAENPNVSQRIIDKLAERATHRWEWRALSGYYSRLARKMNLTIPEHDYSIELLDNTKLTDEQKIVYTYHALSYIAEDLWHDLGSRKILELGYYPDSYDGDHFGPLSILQSGTEYLLTPGFDCAWIEKIMSVDIGYLIDDAESLWEYHVDYDGGNEWSEDLFSDYSTVAVFINGIASGDIQKYDSEIAQELLKPLYEYDDQYSEVDIEILEFPYEGLRYKNMNRYAQETLVRNLIFSHNNDVFNRRFRLSAHLLNLINAHPNTDPAVSAIIEQHDDEIISKAKEYKEKVQRGETIE